MKSNLQQSQFLQNSGDKIIDSLSFKSKYSYLLNFNDGLKKKLGKIKEKEKVYNTVRELYNKRSENYYNEYTENSQ